jgi:protein involved in polysaccharide export with SLBB domain
MPKVKIPFTGGDDTSPPADDPLVPFDPHKPLTYGHTLKLRVYRGTFNPSTIFDGSVMVDHDGMVAFKHGGKAKLGGLTVAKAAVAIQSAFGREYGDALIHVEIEKVENMPIVTVLGAVRSPGAMQWFEGLTVNQALATAGGHDASVGHVVYVTHQGVRHFHSTTDDTKLEAGDVVAFSSDL